MIWRASIVIIIVRFRQKDWCAKRASENLLAEVWELPNRPKCRMDLQHRSLRRIGRGRRRRWIRRRGPTANSNHWRFRPFDFRGRRDYSSQALLCDAFCRQELLVLKSLGQKEHRKPERLKNQQLFTNENLTKLKLLDRFEFVKSVDGFATTLWKS